MQHLHGNRKGHICYTRNKGQGFLTVGCLPRCHCAVWRLKTSVTTVTAGQANINSEWCPVLIACSLKMCVGLKWKPWSKLSYKSMQITVYCIYFQIVYFVYLFICILLLLYFILLSILVFSSYLYLLFAFMLYFYFYFARNFGTETISSRGSIKYSDSDSDKNKKTFAEILFTHQTIQCRPMHCCCK